jgi:sulfite reductase alpha subunit
LTEQEEPNDVVEGNKMLDELERGPWPSHVRETRKTKYPSKLYAASLYSRRDFWTTGGYVSVPGVPTGILMRVTSRPSIGESANVVRVYTPSANFVSSEMLRKLADFADKYGVGMLHALTTGGNVEIPGIPKERIKDFVVEFRQLSGTDVGSTGDAFRNVTNCVGPALCEYANFDTSKMRDGFYDQFFDYAKYPTFPHKMKVKISGCPLDCTRATQKGDIAIVGAWEGSPEIDQESFRTLGEDVKATIVNSCPTRALSLDEGELNVEGDDCIQCMQCVKLSQNTIMPGKTKKFFVYVGGKLRGKKGPFTAKLLAVVDSEVEVFALIDKIVNTFVDNAARKERVGDLITRVGMKKFIAMMGMEPKPYHASELRRNVFYAVTKESKKKEVDELNESVGGVSR